MIGRPGSHVVLLYLLLFGADRVIAMPPVMPGELSALKPNIILIVADDFGYENVGANGGESYNTPTLDRMAAQGVRFTNAFAMPLCTPSRVKLMTGQYSIRNYSGFGRLDRSQLTFGNILQSAGYSTAVAGKWQLGKEPDSPQHFGFDESLLWQHTTDDRFRTRGNIRTDSRYPNPELQLNGESLFHSQGEYGPALCTDFILQFIERNKDGPFFVYYPMILTHWPFDPTPDSNHWDPERAGSLEKTSDLGDPQQNFADMVQYADKIVGKIEQKLDSLDIRENTLLIFTGDNGNDLSISTRWLGKTVRGGKRQLDDNGMRVPLIASWPSVVKGGQTVSSLVDLSDFFPVFAELAGVKLPGEQTVDGESFLPQLLGRNENSRDKIYAWLQGSGTMVRDERYRLVFDHRSGGYSFFDDSTLYAPVVLNIDRLSPEESAAMHELKNHMDQVLVSTHVLPQNVVRFWWRIEIHLVELYEKLMKQLNWIQQSLSYW